ncbi:MAG: glycosyltransferase family 4 protein [Flavobacteriales bacterium]|nr:glycosyltransferase family 4 protein [Flavobacteriales bacterium]MBL6873682.1 glycosyltransferase family 4 protein [Flavobacteriales bacterium]
MEKRVAIIDPVGIKSGMNHYDTYLCQALDNINVQTFIYSNFEYRSKSIVAKVFFGTFFSSKIHQTFNFLKGMVLSCLDCKRQGVKELIVHVFSTHNMAFFTYLISKFFGFKIITISHDVSSFTNQDNSLYHRLIYNHWSEHIIVHNDYSRKNLLPLISPKVHSKIRIIKHGGFTDLPDSNITKTIARKELKLDADSPYILFFGRFKPTKRLDVLLRAIPKVNPNVRLIIAGDTGKENFEKYQKIIDELNISQRLILDINYISDARRELYFKAVDAMILPYEIIFQSGVLLMAMSYGLPVVASNITPFEEVVEHNKNGLLFESLSIDDLADKINSLFDGKKSINTYSKSALETMNSSFSWNQIAASYKSLLS